ncbi:Hypothetical predicted protein [Octopus vulgaris]|uniref:Craniofacial development protein 2-like n=1 Tax=Octopus vulgaris TaxID=6645 RepID=A0AA36F3M6_OCTVU|nr:Hypothetical predicted protein [Octopus vulgaris]
MCDRLLKLRLVLQNSIVTIISAYTPQVGLPDEQKDHFYDILLQATSKTNDNDPIFVAGDFNGHIGCQSNIFHGVHGGHRIGSQNEDGTRLLEFCDANNLLICNINFRKPASYLITYQSVVSVAVVVVVAPSTAAAAIVSFSFLTKLDYMSVLDIKQQCGISFCFCEHV